MMWSFGTTPRGNTRFKLGQMRTTHTHMHTVTFRVQVKQTYRKLCRQCSSKRSSSLQQRELQVSTSQQLLWMKPCYSGKVVQILLIPEGTFETSISSRQQNLQQHVFKIISMYASEETAATRVTTHSSIFVCSLSSVHGDNNGTQARRMDYPTSSHQIHRK